MNDIGVKEGRDKGWFWVENNLIDRTDLKPAEKIVYIVLVRHSNETSTCYPGLKTIEQKSGLGKSTVRNAIKVLEEKKLISKKIIYKSENPKEIEKTVYTLHNVELCHGKRAVHKRRISRADTPMSGVDTGISGNDTGAEKSEKTGVSENGVSRDNTPHANTCDTPVSGDDTKGIYKEEDEEEEEKKKNDPIGRTNFFFDTLIKNLDLNINQMAKEVLIKNNYFKVIKYNIEQLNKIINTIEKVKFINIKMRKKTGNDRNFMVWITNNIDNIFIEQFQDSEGEYHGKSSRNWNKGASNKGTANSEYLPPEATDW